MSDFELSPVFMGILCLAVLWTATALVVAVVLRDALRLRRRQQQLRGAGLAEGTIVEGVLARHTEELTGRVLPRAKTPTILLHPRAQQSEILGGKIRLDDGTLIEIPALPRAASEVWRAEAKLPGLEFSAAFAESKRAKGWRTTLTTELGAGQRVWVFGQLDQGKLAPISDAFEPSSPDRVLVSLIDPRAFYSRKIGFSIAAAIAILAAACLVTALALVPPAFGLVSTIGGALCLGYFLGVQPIGVWIADQIAAPAIAVTHRKMVEPAPAGQASAAALSARP